MLRTFEDVKQKENDAPDLLEATMRPLKIGFRSVTYFIRFQNLNIRF